MELLVRAEARWGWKAPWDDYLALVNLSPSTFRLLVTSPGGDTSSLHSAPAALNLLPARRYIEVSPTRRAQE